MRTEIREIQEAYTIRGEQVTVVTKARFDHATGKQVFDQELDNEAINTAFDAYRSNHMMITPSRIKALRQRWNLSQRDFAALLGWSATTVATYETGALPSKANNKLLLALEATPELAQSLYESSKGMMTERGKQTFQAHAGDTAEQIPQKWIEKGINQQFEATNYSEYSGFSAFDLKKFANMVLYFVEQVPQVTKTKLNKLLFYTDFKFFAQNTVSITGVPYARLPYGPVPNEYSLLYGAIENAKQLREEVSIDGGTEWTFFTTTANFNSALFTEKELATMMDTVRRFGHLNASELSEKSHQERAWQANDTGKLISYLYANDLTTLK